MNILSHRLHLSFDASVRDGVAYYGWVFYGGPTSQKIRIVRQRHGVLGRCKSPMVAEYDSLINALQWLHGNGGCRQLRIQSDSKAVVDHVHGRRTINRACDDRRKECRRLLANVATSWWNLRWVHRSKNQKADRLAGMGVTYDNR